MAQKQKILIVVGPTSSGKSALAVDLAKTFNGEVISADSRQVYRGLDIGTGKITKAEMKGILHHLLNVASPKKIFTAHDYTVMTRHTIEDIVSRGKLPIITGGTGFYIDALVGGVALPNAPVNPGLRKTLEKKTAPELFALLKQRDPVRAKNIDPHNPRRLIRALEIAVSLGKNPPAQSGMIYHTAWFGVLLSNDTLKKKIRKRLKARLRQGMIAEAKKLYASGLSYKRMEAFGLEYRALARLLQKKTTRAEFEEELFRDIRHYAKRQMTYWRRNKDIKWFKKSQKQEMAKMIREWLGGR